MIYFLADSFWVTCRVSAILLEIWSGLVYIRWVNPSLCPIQNTDSPTSIKVGYINGQTTLKGTRSVGLCCKMACFPTTGKLPDISSCHHLTVTFTVHRINFPNSESSIVLGDDKTDCCLVNSVVLRFHHRPPPSTVNLDLDLAAHLPKKEVSEINKNIWNTSYSVLICCNNMLSLFSRTYALSRVRLI